VISPNIDRYSQRHCVVIGFRLNFHRTVRIILAAKMKPPHKRVFIGILVFVVVLVILYSVSETQSRRPYSQEPAFEKTNVVLVLWPEHIELRQASDLSDLLPRPRNASYSFLIPEEKRRWVEEQVRDYEDSSEVGWHIDIEQIDADRQRIEVDRIGHHRMGLIYEATPNGVLLLQTRANDPIFALLFGYLPPFCIIGTALYGFAWIIWKLTKRLGALA
jgi:hypothetical protein